MCERLDGVRGWDGRRPALVVAHPGHELRVHGWLETTRPRVFVLTDGSGRSGISRLAHTTRGLERVRSERGALYGRFTDRDLYAAILRGEARLFQQLVGELAATLTDSAFTDVVGDAADGYNPAHDLCRLLINAAVELARSTSEVPIRNYDFALTDEWDRTHDDRGVRVISYELDDATLARKAAAARAYAPLDVEVGAAVAGEGLDAFRVERLREVHEPGGRYELAEVPPFYEMCGAARVTAGHYEQVLRYRDHMLPIADAIRTYVAGGGTSCAGR